VLDDKVLDVEAVTEEDGEEHLRFAISPKSEPPQCPVNTPISWDRACPRFRGVVHRGDRPTPGSR